MDVTDFWICPSNKVILKLLLSMELNFEPLEMRWGEVNFDASGHQGL